MINDDYFRDDYFRDDDDDDDDDDGLSSEGIVMPGLSVTRGRTPNMVVTDVNDDTGTVTLDSRGIVYRPRFHASLRAWLDLPSMSIDRPRFDTASMVPVTIPVAKDPCWRCYNGEPGRAGACVRCMES